MTSRVLTFIATLFAANLLCVAVMGQQDRTYPAFTLVTRYTEYGVKGEELRVSTSTRYQSSSGDWRSVNKSDGDEHASLYRRGAGVYQSNSRTSRLIKEMSHAPGCPLRTAADLRADSKFDRTEDVLGFTAYVLVDRAVKDLVMERYYVAELGGGTPVKSKTTHSTGLRFEAEPISIRVGEPDPLDVSGPDYVVIEQEPVWSNNLDEQLLSKPDPEYPADAIARRLSGVVTVMITIDDLGQAVVAAVRPGSAPSPLREAAIEAAYKASFKPMVVDGRPVIARGYINYQFVRPK
jgi:TonB family protein